MIKGNLKGDIFGGLTAGIVALPLALAFGVGLWRSIRIGRKCRTIWSDDTGTACRHNPGRSGNHRFAVNLGGSR